MGIWGQTMTFLGTTTPPHFKDTRAIGLRTSSPRTWVTLHTCPWEVLCWGNQSGCHHGLTGTGIPQCSDWGPIHLDLVEVFTTTLRYHQFIIWFHLPTKET